MQWQEKSEDTRTEIRREIYRIRRYHGHNKERTKGQTMIYKTLHRKLKIE
jgi:hypothetical protein